jgi:hypothetical protein
MLIATPDITTRYGEGLTYLSNITYNKFARDLYGNQQPKSNESDLKLTLLLYGLTSWSNLPGAVNSFTEPQMLSMMDNIARLQNDMDSLRVMSVDKPLCPSSATSAFTLSIVDTASVDLALVNNILSASVKRSAAAGNALQQFGDGLYVSNAGGGSNDIIKVYVTMTTLSSSTYSNALFTGKELLVTTREGFVLKDTDLALVGDTISYLNGDTFDPGVWYTFVLKTTSVSVVKVHVEYTGLSSPSYANSLFDGKFILMVAREGMIIDDSIMSLAADTISYTNGDTFEPETWYTFILKS